MLKDEGERAFKFVSYSAGFLLALLWWIIVNFVEETYMIQNFLPEDVRIHVDSIAPRK